MEKRTISPFGNARHHIGSKCDIKTVQHRLGHSDVETTLNIYAHAIDANDEAAAMTIAALQL